MRKEPETHSEWILPESELAAGTTLTTFASGATSITGTLAVFFSVSESESDELELELESDEELLAAFFDLTFKTGFFVFSASESESEELELELELDDAGLLATLAALTFLALSLAEGAFLAVVEPIHIQDTADRVSHRAHQSQNHPSLNPSLQANVSIMNSTT